MLPLHVVHDRMHAMHSAAPAFDLNLLAVLDAVAERRNVTRAAEQLGLSQSAVSHALARLRERVRDPLFVRGSSGLTLTPKAEKLARVTRGTLSQLENALRESTSFEPKTSSRSFHVAAADVFDIVMLPGLLGSLRREAPHVDLTLSRPNFQALSSMLESGEIDVHYGVLPGPNLFVGLLPAPATQALATLKLYDEGWVCLIRKGHPRLSKRPTLRQYAAEEHIVIAAGGSGPAIVDRELERHRLTRRVALRLSSFHSAVECVRRSDLLWTGPQRVADCLDPERELLHVSPPVELPTYPTRLVWHERFSGDPAHRWFRELLVSVITGRAPRSRRRAPGAG